MRSILRRMGHWGAALRGGSPLFVAGRDWGRRLDADVPLANPRHEKYCRERVRGAGGGSQLDYTSVNAVRQLGKTLLDALPKEDGRPRPSAPSAGTQGRRVDAVNLPRRRAHRHTPVTVLCQECCRQWEIGQLAVFRLALTLLLLQHGEEGAHAVYLTELEGVLAEARLVWDSHSPS